MKNTRWYEWNKDNKQIFIICLSYLINPVTFSYTQNFAINFQLGIKVTL